MLHWVIQVFKGTYSAYGPYKSEEAARNRYEKTSGGEVFLFSSWEKEPEKAVEGFKLAQMDGRI